MTSTNIELLELNGADITCDLSAYEAGSGGFGDVLIGHHKGLKQYVAVKVFAVTGGAHEKARIEKAMKEEMEHLLKVEHDNVVRVLGYVKWSFTMGIVMEYCRGGNLKELLLDTSKELGNAVRVRFLSEVASAIAACHNLPDKRLIHEDLKPENIMLTVELHCKVGDFGSSELATYTSSGTKDPFARSKKERPQYTLFYTAPEKLKDLTTKPRKEHDVYAFGMVVFWALARKSPYPPMPVEEQKKLVKLIKEGKRPDCQEIDDWIQTLVGEDREIAEQLQLLMKRCWKQNPSKRPTMIEIKKELNALLEKQKTTKLLSQVVTTLTQMNLDDQPQMNERQRVPLHWFSTRTRRFHVPFASDDTEERSIEPPEVTQEKTQSLSSQQKKIKSSNSTQEMDLTRYGAALSAPPEETAHSSITLPHQPADTNATKEKSWEITQPKTTTESLPGGDFKPKKTSASKQISKGIRNFFRGIKNPTMNPASGDFNKRIQNYVDLLQTQKYDEAKTTKHQISQSFEGHLEVTGENLEENGTRHQNDGKYLKAILFFSIAADFYVKKDPNFASAKRVVACAQGIQETIELLLENSDVSSESKNMVACHVIPLMLVMTQHIQVLPINEKNRCLQAIRCSYQIALSQSHIGDLASNEATIKFGLELMKKNFGKGSSKYQIYGHLLNNLGEVCEKTSRLKESVKYFAKSIKAYQTAEDLTQEKRSAYIAISEANLQTNKAQMKK